MQSSLVCLLNHSLLLSELYLGVPTKATVTLFNKTLLPSHFSWAVGHNLFDFIYVLRVRSSKVYYLFFWSQSQLQGKHAELCTATFDPPSGTLGPGCRRDIVVSFISHADVSVQITKTKGSLKQLTGSWCHNLFVPPAYEILVLYFKMHLFPVGAARADCPLCGAGDELPTCSSLGGSQTKGTERCLLVTQHQVIISLER